MKEFINRVLTHNATPSDEFLCFILIFGTPILLFCIAFIISQLICYYKTK
jgi:hypothetical protein